MINPQHVVAMGEELEAAHLTIGRVWKALGMATYLDANGKEISECVAELKSQTEWQPIETAPKDGSRILLFVCTRGSLRRGWPEICWWGKHEHWGDSWLRHNGKEIVGPGVATHWMPLPPTPRVSSPVGERHD